MKKVSIARRRIENINHGYAGSPTSSMGLRTVPFQKMDYLEAVDSCIGWSSRFEPVRSPEPGLVEVELGLERRERINTLISQGELPLSGNLKRDPRGVIMLNLEVQDNRNMKLVSAKTISEMLEICPRTVYRMHRQGRLPGLKIGRNLRFRFREVLDFLESCDEQRKG